MSKTHNAILTTLYALEEDLIAVFGKDWPYLEQVMDRFSFMQHDVMQLTEKELWGEEDDYYYDGQLELFEPWETY